MNIYSLQFGFGTEIKDFISLNIYFAGCKNNKKCKRNLCQNKKLHNFTVGNHFTFWQSKIANIVKKDLCDSICFLGGEPFDMPISGLKDLCNYIRSINDNLKIYAYSGYDNPDFILYYIRELKLEDVYFGAFISNESNNQLWYSEYVSLQSELLIS